MSYFRALMGRVLVRQTQLLEPNILRLQTCQASCWSAFARVVSSAAVLFVTGGVYTVASAA